MDDSVETSNEVTGAEEEVRPKDLGHPRGTLAIVILYALLFAAIWLGLYFFEFLPRGAPHP